MIRQRLQTPARLAAAVLVIGASLTATALSAGADSGRGPLAITQFEGTPAASSSRNTLEFSYTGEPPQPTSVTVSENGQPVTLDAAPVPLTRERGLVFVIDSGTGMNDGNLLPQVRETIQAQARAHPDVEVAIVQAGDQADVRTDFTLDPVRLANALNAVGPTSGSAVNNALTQASAMLGQRSRLQPNIVLVTADNDNINPEAGPEARSAILADALLLYTVAYGGQGSQLADPAPYQALMATTGGTLVLQPDREAFLADLRSDFSTVAERQFRVSWSSTVAAGEPLRVEVAVGDARDRIDVLAGRGIYRGYQQLHPDLGPTQFTLPLVDNPAVLGLALLLVLIGVGGAAYSVTSAFAQTDLKNVLQPYSDAYGLMEGEVEGESGNKMLGKSAFMKRAVALTEQVAENQGLLTRAEGALERANLPLRAGEALFVYACVVLALTVVPMLLTRSLIPGLIFGVLGAMIPLAGVSYVAKARRRKFLSQLPDTLSLLSGTLKAGFSLMQGVEAVSREVSEPMGLELRRVVTESRLGRPLEDSLEASADRMDSPDFAWAVMAIGIQREVGGNLAELLMTVADTMVARERLRRDVASLTAEGRVSAYMLAAMPPILTLVMYVLNKEYVSTLFKDGLGLALVGLATFSMIVGFFWMKKIITIEI